MEAFPGPLGRLRDPLLERDYVRLCSRPSFFRNRCLAALLAGVIVLLVYGVASLDDTPLDRIGWIVHMTFTWTAALLALMAATSEAAVAIPTERATGTLVVLLTVPLSTRRLAAGFLGSRLAFALTGLLALLPIEGFALLLGGVSLRDLLLSAAAVGTCALYGAAAGTLAGNGASTHRLALGRSLSFFLAHALVLPALFLAILGIFALRFDGRPDLEWIGEGLGWAAGSFFFSSPVGPLVVLSGGRMTGFLPVPTALLHGVPAVVAVLLAALAVARAGTRLALETESGFVAPSRGRKGAAAAPSPGRLPRGVWRFPLLWKESRPEREWWKRWGRRVAVGAALLGLAWLFVDPRVRENLAGSRWQLDRKYWFYDAFISAPLWFLAISLLPFSATMVAEEREKQAFDLLRASPLAPWEYILARPVGLLVKLWPFAAGVVVITLYGIATGVVHWLSPLCWLAGSVLVLPGLALLGFRLGLTAPTVRSANRRAGSVIAFLMFGFPMALGFLAALFRWGDETRFLLGIHPGLCLSAPLVLLAHGLDPTPDRETLETAVAGIVGGVLWFGAAALLWRLLPNMVREAFHGKNAE